MSPPPTAGPGPSKADAAYAAIRRQILDGTLEAGSRLAQYELADALGVSITPLREAVRRLSGEGWVLLDAHRNARVAPLDAEGARHVLEVRRALEPTAVALAAERHTEEDATRLRAALADLVPVTRAGGEPALDAHRALHRALVAAAHNPELARMLDDLWDRSDRYRRMGLQRPPGEAPRTQDHDEHHELTGLVLAGEAEAAASLMAAHIDRSLTATAVLSERDAAGT